MGMDMELFTMSLSRYSALTHTVVGSFLPLLALAIMTLWFGKEKSIKPALKAAPFALFAGISFTIPYYLTAHFLGPELPSIIGGLVGLCLVVPAAKFGFLVPREKWDFPEKSEWDNQWIARRDLSDPAEAKMPLLTAWMPYILIAAVLVLTRIPALGLKNLLVTQSIDLPAFFGIDKSYSLKWAYNPGIIPFLLIGIVTQILYRMKLDRILNVWKSSVFQVSGAAIALFAGIAMVQLMLSSGINPSGLPSMLTVMANALARVAGKAYLLVSPFIGVLGAFMSGSNTVSNILFSSLQFETAGLLKLPGILVVTLQVVGGSIGNMICINNIVAVSATVGIVGMEGRIIRKNVIPVIIYGLAAALFIGILIKTGNFQ
jgi:lactate permease